MSQVLQFHWHGWSSLAAMAHDGHRQGMDDWAWRPLLHVLQAALPEMRVTRPKDWGSSQNLPGQVILARGSRPRRSPFQVRVVGQTCISQVAATPSIVAALAPFIGIQPARSGQLPCESRTASRAVGLMSWRGHPCYNGRNIQYERSSLMQLMLLGFIAGDISGGIVFQRLSPHDVKVLLAWAVDPCGRAQVLRDRAVALVCSIQMFETGWPLVSQTAARQVVRR
jgi:hypothetical protein